MEHVEHGAGTYKDQGKEMGANRSKYVREKKGNKCVICISNKGATSHKWATRVQMSEDALSNDSTSNGKCA